MSDILLINPRTELDISSRKFNREPPYGILILFAVLKKQGFKVDFIDLSVESETQLKLILENNPSVVGITALTNTFPLSLEILRKIKSSNSEIKTIIGGPHVTFQIQETLSENEIDYVIVGEGEESVPSLLGKILLRDSELNVPGTAYKQKNKFHICKQSLPINLNGLPLPAREELVKKYSVADIIVNRGCPFQCSFCVRQKLFQNVRIRDPKSVIEEMNQIMSYNYEYFNIYDNINISREFVNKICSEMIKSQISLPWGCELRIDLLDRDTALNLKKAGCLAIATGIESGSEEVLCLNNKNQDLKKVKKGIYNAKKANLCIQAYFVVGLPGETHETFLKTEEFITSLELEPGIDRINFFIATPYPGSDLYQCRNKYGIRIFEKKWELWDCEHIIFETKTLHKADIEKMVEYWKELEDFFAKRT